MPVFTDNNPMQATAAIGEIFVTSGLVSSEQMEQALEKQRQLKSHEQIGDLLVSMGLITERDRVRCLGEQWGVTYVDLADIRIDEDVVTAVGQELARRFKVVPISSSGNRLTLAMKNPLDIFAIDEIRLITGKEIEPVIATEEDIIAAITANYRSDINLGDAVSDVMKDLGGGDITLQMAEDDDRMTIEQLKEMSGEAPVVRLANMVISRAIHGQSLGHPYRACQGYPANPLSH